MASEHTAAVFAAQLILLLLVGRMLGEGMSRLGQPAIFGQLLAGVVLGPSVFGALIPEIRGVIFPDTPALKSMSMPSRKSVSCSCSCSRAWKRISPSLNAGVGP